MKLPFLSAESFSWKDPLLFKDSISTRSWFILLNVVLPSIMAVFSAICTILAGTSIEGDLAIEGSVAQWITIIYLLGINSGVLIANKLADRFGYKKLYFLAIFIFTLGTFFSAIAWGFSSLFIARLIEGIGGGFIFPTGLAILVQNTPKERLRLFLNLYLGMGLGLGLSLGASVCGYLAMESTWRMIFFCLLPVGIVGLLFTVLFHSETEKNHPGKFDFLGYFSFVAFIAFLLIPLSEGNLKSTAEGWRSPYILGCFFIAFFCFLLTLYAEKNTQNPILPLHLFKDPFFSIGCLTLFALGMAFFVSLSLLSKYMENALLFDKKMTGLVCAIYGLTMGGGSIVANILSEKFSGSILSIMGLTIIIISYFLNNELTWLSGKPLILFILALRGLGIALSLGPITAQSLKRVAKEDAGNASTLLTFFRQVGGTYGGVILGIVLIRRNIFHTARFSEPIHPSLPGYKYTFAKITEHIYQNTSATLPEAKLQAKEVIIQNVKTQAYIQAINDSFIFFAYITLAITLLLIALNLYQTFFQKEKQESN